jgi:ribosomal protein S18 acetylase RimI-like enzyme
MTSPISYQVHAFGTDALAPAGDLARLHATLLPASPLSCLGRPFMECFYYARLPRAGLLCGAVAYANQEAVGFVAATHDPDRFMRSALRRWWPSLLWVIGTSVLRAPRSAAAVWEACRVMRSRVPAAHAPLAGEILSLGVLPDYRSAAFLRQSGLRIPTDLLDNAVAQLRRRGVQVVRATVQADNTAAQMFYSGLGWTLSRRDLPGWQTATLEFVRRI